MLLARFWLAYGTCRRGGRCLRPTMRNVAKGDADLEGMVVVVGGWWWSSGIGDVSWRARWGSWRIEVSQGPAMRSMSNLGANDNTVTREI